MSGKTLDKLVADGITKPLQMRDTGYNPDPKKKQRIAATEYQAAPARGMVWGSVHDENAWSLAASPGMRASSVLPTTWRCWRRRS